jgi:nicotinate dehydrogenase subunit B
MSERPFAGFELEPERYELHATPDEPLGLDRREFFRVLGGGLVVLCLLREAPAQESGRGRRRGTGGPVPKEIDAWLHVDEDGTVTACTGKVEVGQNARTSLTQAVADELRLDPESVRLVMGDTARVPFDMGTFGSRTTPTMAPQLRRAAAAARALLIGLAADLLKVEDRAALEVVGGKVTHRPTGRSASFGELTRGRKLLEVIDEDAQTTPADRWEVAGRSVPKVDGRAFVTGRHPYTSDVKRPGMLRGKVLRPPAFDAKLAALDAAEARALPGVTVVHDGDFVGVAAPDEPTAARAVAALRAEWTTKAHPADRDLPAYFKEHASDVPRPGGPTRAGRGAEGDGPASGDVTLAASYSVAYIAHAPLEPRVAVAEWSDGGLTVWTGTQRPFGVRGELAQALGLPEEKVRVIVPDTGAGYGGKHTGEVAIEAARLAKAAGRPVKLAWTREEEFTWAYFRPGGLIDVTARARKDGTLTAWEFHNYNSGAAGIETPYEVPDRGIRFHPTATPLRQGSYRALASTANHFARETAMDELALAAGLDPLAFRLKNLGDPRLRAVFEAAAGRFGWGQKPAPGRGVGIAGGTEKGGYVASCAEVAADRAGGPVRVVRLVTAFECGAIVNPDHLQNQVEGALIMGLGGALFEAIRFADGKILNARFTRYRVPRFSDVPAIEVVLLDRKDLPSSGAGEAPIVAVAPAVGNAICAATGIRLRSLPMVPGGLKT